MELIEFIISANQFLEQSILFQGFKFVIGVILVVLSLNILILMYMLIIKDKYYRAWSLGHGIPDIINTMSGRWHRIVKMAKSNNIEEKKEAIIEAGNILYEVLEKIGHEGDSLDQMLGNMTGSQLANISDLKKASIVKNSVINNENYELSDDIVLNTVKAFGEALMEQEAIKELGI